MIGHRLEGLDGLLRSVGGVLRRLTEQAGDLVFLDLHGRVAKLLLRLADAESRDPDEPVTLDLNLTQTDLAEMVGGSRQSVNQILHYCRDRDRHARGRCDQHGARVRHMTAFKVLNTDANVVVARNTYDVGGNSGWHSHPGKVIIAVESGEVTLYRGDDATFTGTTHAAGEIFVEKPGVVYLGRNESTTTQAVLMATYFKVATPAQGSTSPPR